MLPGQWVFERPAHFLFDNLKPRRLMELLPSVTYSVNQARATLTVNCGLFLKASYLKRF
jgi:hypothetical protein